MIVSLTSAAEAILFAVGSEGMKIQALADALQVSSDEAEGVCRTLQREYDERSAGLQLVFQNNVWQLVTRPEYGPYLRRMANGPQSPSLSQAALEVLAIVAYRQPIARAGIESLRGVQSDRAVATLVHRQLIHEIGRAEGPGRPILYGTTALFLQSFGFQSLEDLPPIPAAAELPLDLNLFELNRTTPRD